jgi:hypothetical protein
MHSGAAGYQAPGTWSGAFRKAEGRDRSMRQVTRKGLITVAAAGGVLALGGGYAQADSGAEGAAVGSPGVLSGNNVQVPVDVPVNVCGNTVNVVGLLNPAIGNHCANVSSSDRGSGAHRGGSDVGGHGGQHGASYGGSYGGGSHGGRDDGGYGGSGGGSHRGPEDGHSGGSHSGGSHSGGSQGGGWQSGGSHAGGGASHSPGIGSGNNIEVPIDIPVNLCDLGITAIGLGNPVTGGSCENAETPAPPVVRTPHHPATPATPHTPSDRTVPPVPNVPGPQTVPAAPHGTPELAHTGAGGLGIAVPAAAGMLLAGTILYRRSRSAA